MNGRRSTALLSLVAFGYAFLYVPIAILILYSFNDSQLVSVWSHFSTRWYGELFKNAQMRDAAWLSFSIAIMSATASILLGTAAAFALRPMRASPGRSLFEALLITPLILPEVLTGLAMLLLFVFFGEAIGWPRTRGISTIVIAHITFGMAYATVVIRARLSQQDPVLEEAAADLGATPWRIFSRVSLPLLAPALVAAWLLAFTLSLDDVVISSFVTGPGASTLPIVVLSSVRLGVSPQINALASLLVLFVAMLMMAATLVLRGGTGRNNT
ncbi:ABC transporter permease subunit [Methyloferula stellata]|uniref:ABC transporter permease subunit n=1 Tax=Methyloferula stellata TaxID=876270 RepID=UPI0003823CEC|nr:ABC transporter permease subunit [Methyloferula stellata]